MPITDSHERTDAGKPKKKKKIRVKRKRQDFRSPDTREASEPKKKSGVVSHGRDKIEAVRANPNWRGKRRQRIQLDAPERGRLPGLPPPARRDDIGTLDILMSPFTGPAGAAGDIGGLIADATAAGYHDLAEDVRRWNDLRKEKGLLGGTLAEFTAEYQELDEDSGKILNVVSPELGKLARGEEEDVDPLWLGTELAMLPLPLKGLPTALSGVLRATRAAKVAKGAGGAKAAAKAFGATIDEPIRPVERAIRTLQLGEKVQQLPAARSRITRNFIERPADWTSRQLMREESKAAALVRKALPTASVQARVAKAAGRQQTIQTSRIQARMVKNLNLLPKEGSAEDIAHFWWAQLPKSKRNAEGLQLVREAQAKELEELVSGRALEGIKKQQAAVRAELKAATESEKVFDLMTQTEELKILATDIPNQIEDLSASLAQLDQVIAKPPSLNEKIIEAVRNLSGDRKAVLVEANVLKPEKAAGRETLVSRWLGLDPEEEVYIGHMIGKPRGSQPSLMPVSVGTGRVRLPEGVASENKLVLAKSGRLRASTHVAAQDWQASQVYRQAVQARDDLGKMGSQFTGRVPEDHFLINPKGRALPPQWKTDKLPRLVDAEEEEVRQAAEDIVKSFMAKGDDIEAMLAAAREAGVSWDELRVVPKAVVNRYYGQFVPARSATIGGKAYDSAVDMVAASIVFARLGYIPKNIAQNLIMSVPHQGPFMLVNIPRAAQALVDDELRPLLSAEVGFSGATYGLSKEISGLGRRTRGATHAAVETVGKIADNPLRISAFIHESAADGVISKLNPVLTESDRVKLIDLLTNPAKEAQLNDIRARAVEAMGDFSRLTPIQRKWARRFLIIPGWLWAGSRYPVHFAATHPLRSAAIGYAAAGEPYADRLGLPQNPPITEAFAGNIPWYLEGIGGEEGKVLRTTSLSPVSTPWEIAGAVGAQSPRTAASYANPLAAALYNIAGRQAPTPYGTYSTDFETSLLRNLERLAPNVTFGRQLVSPSGEGLYPEDATRLGRLKREAGVIPIEIRREEDVDKSSEGKARADVERFAEMVGVAPPKEVLDAIEAKGEWEEVLKKAHKDTDDLSEEELAKLKFDLLVRLKPQYAQYRSSAYAAFEDPTRVRSADSKTDKFLGWDLISSIREKLHQQERRLVKEAQQHSG